MKTRQCSSFPGSSGRIQPGPAFAGRTLAAVLLALLCQLGLSGRAQAQSYAGSSVDLHGVTFTYSETQYNGYPVDVYVPPEGSNYGNTYFNGTQFSGIATVSHDNDSNGLSFNGFWNSNSSGYVDAHAENPLYDTHWFGSNYYYGTTYEQNTSLDYNSGSLLTSYVYHFNSSSGDVTVSIGTNGNGSITGVETGVVLANSWYADTTESYTYDYRSVGAYYYTSTTRTTHYSLSGDSSPQLLTSYVYNYYDANNHRGFSASVGTDGNGFITGDETGVVINGSYYFNSGGSLSGSDIPLPPNPLFDRTYNFDSGTYSITYKGDGSASRSESVTFKSNDGQQASYTISGTQSHSATEEFFGQWSASLTGNDPAIGSLSATLTYVDNNPVWTGTTTRNSPSFAPSTLYYPDQPINFVSGTLNFNGDASDYYVTPDGYVSVTITGNLRDRDNNPYNYQAGVSAVYYGYNYNYGGVYNTYNGTFSGVGFDLRTSQRTTNSNTHTSGPTYWVNGVLPLIWRDGGDSSDSDGNGSSWDNFGNPITGDTLSISSSYTSSPTYSSSASLYFEGNYFWGQDIGSLYSYNGVPVPSISGSGSTAPGDPAALYLSTDNPYYTGGQVGNVFYRAGDDASYYYSLGGLKMIVTGSSGSYSCHVYAPNTSDTSQNFDFSMTGQPGVFNFTDASGTLRFGLVLNADETVQVSTSGPPQDYPASIYVYGQSNNYSYVGTATDLDDPGQSSLYYVQRNLDTNTFSYSVRGLNLLKIRSDNSVFLLYPYGTIGTGTYDPPSHLFQASGGPGTLPMPTYGIDMLNNGLPFVLTPPEGFPASAVINGQLWRFAYVDGDGVLHYQGYYAGQTLTIGADDGGRGGVRDVALTDPYGTNETGQYHNFTFGMSGATGVGAGTITGGVINPLNIPRQSVAGDIDIFGNILSLGALSDDADAAGLTMSFSDDGTTASLNMALARPSSAWIWSHSTSPGSTTLVNAMKLDASHRLDLYDPANTSTPAIKLDPAGKSSVNADFSVHGVLRTGAHGDLSMGGFTNGPQP